MKIHFKNSKQLKKLLEDKAGLDLAKEAIKKNHSQMHKKIVSNAEFKGHMEWQKGKGYAFVKPTGQTRRSVIGNITDDGLRSLVKPTTEYAPYLEYGTRFMDKQPFVKPAFNKQKEVFKKDIMKLIT